MTGGKATKHIVETIAKVIFLICAAVAIVAVLSITVYMFAKGTPALAKVGVIDLLFGTVWQPTAATPSYGILYIILTSIAGTAVAILIGVPIGILTAVFITEVSNKKLAAIVQPAVELLAAIPSVIYGLLGLMVLNPLMYRLEKRVFAGSTTHQFTGGSNLLSDYCTGNHDFAYGNQYQCFLHPSSTRTFKICFACPRSNTYPDDI